MVSQGWDLPLHWVWLKLSFWIELLRLISAKIQVALGMWSGGV